MRRLVATIATALAIIGVLAITVQPTTRTWLQGQGGLHQLRLGPLTLICHRPGLTSGCRSVRRSRLRGPSCT
jgi:hypothetical protein